MLHPFEVGGCVSVCVFSFLYASEMLFFLFSLTHRATAIVVSISSGFWQHQRGRWFYGLRSRGVMKATVVRHLCETAWVGPLQKILGHLSRRSR